MAIDSAEIVKELRERTGAGIMDCKAALQATGGDMEKAVDFLRKKGAASALKRAGREAKEGVIALKINGDSAALAEVNCETDFVARTEDFQALASLALDETFAKGDAAASSDKVAARVSELSGKIGEKILVRRTKLVKSAGGKFFGYVHANRKIGVLVEIAASKPGPELEQLGKDLAMQVAASHPLALSRDGVPAATVEREKAIFREEIKGKPENIVEKILQGKLDKFYQSVCLVEQPYIKDEGKTIEQLISEAVQKYGERVEVGRMVRFSVRD